MGDSGIRNTATGVIGGRPACYAMIGQLSSNVKSGGRGSGPRALRRGCSLLILVWGWTSWWHHPPCPDAGVARSESMVSDQAPFLVDRGQEPLPVHPRLTSDRMLADRWQPILDPQTSIGVAGGRDSSRASSSGQDRAALPCDGEDQQRRRVTHLPMWRGRLIIPCFGGGSSWMPFDFKESDIRRKMRENNNSRTREQKI